MAENLVDAQLGEPVGGQGAKGRPPRVERVLPAKLPAPKVSRFLYQVKS